MECSSHGKAPAVPRNASVPEKVCFDDWREMQGGWPMDGRRLIPIDEDLRCVGVLPPLDAPHHQRSTEWSRFREGVALETDDTGSIVDIGLEKVISGSSGSDRWQCSV